MANSPAYRRAYYMKNRRRELNYSKWYRATAARKRWKRQLALLLEDISGISNSTFWRYVRELRRTT